MNTQDKKELLLKDLCARLPYGVKCEVYNCIGVLDEVTTFYGVGVTYSNGQDTTCRIDECKPYLFPLSSMTEGQREELYKMGWYLDEDKIYSSFRNYDDVNHKTHTDCFELINWCYKNKFDINGLVPMGLANDATGLNIY